MPANRPRASFEPLPPDIDIPTLVENTPNFQYVDRISYEKIKEHGQEKFDQLVLLHVIIKGKPLVIDGLEQLLDRSVFHPKWLHENHGNKVENARDLTSQENIVLTIGHYLSHMAALTNQFFESKTKYRDKQLQKVYLKDIDCPPVWEEKVRQLIPLGLMYLNETTGEPGGPGSVPQMRPDGSGMELGPGIAPAGDLMSSLPPEMRAENLMCYIGHEGTYTPAHREMCASLGQNIMVDASGDGIGPDGQRERPGSSIWFMTETSDRHLVAEYWLSALGHDIEVEKHFAQLAAWKQAPFKTYIVEQRVGDFILVPPLAPHQVWNRGTRTVKVAWNRTTVETLEKAFNEALPNQRMVCRDEQYKNKAIVYFTLLKYAGLLDIVRQQLRNGSAEDIERIRRSRKVRQVQKDFNRLFDIFKSIMLSEQFSLDPQVPDESPEFIPFDSNVTCAYCRGNIFNRFLTCKTCKDVGTGVDEPYDVCMECFVMGRSCRCQSGYTWVEQFQWHVLVQNYEHWRHIVISSGVKSTPKSLTEEREAIKTRTLAELCQSQLELRPWVDIRKLGYGNGANSDDDEDDEDADGKPRRRYRFGEGLPVCHVCRNPHPSWTCAQCSSCERWWCYGTLWRAYDMMPQTVMEDPIWDCPHCRRVCNTGGCRRDPRQEPYEPKGTLLGHDTKVVADPRSVECLVDFSKPNTNWTKISDQLANPNVRLERRLAEAETVRAQDAVLDADRYAPEEGLLHTAEYNPGQLQDRGLNEITFENDDYGSNSRPGAAGAQFGPNGFNSVNPADNGQGGSGFHNPASGDQPGKMAGAFPSSAAEERQMLESAREQNRLLITLARSRGLSQIVKLRFSPRAFSRIMALPWPRNNATGSDAPIHPSAILLESNIPPGGFPVEPPPPKPEKAKKSKSKSKKGGKARQSLGAGGKGRRRKSGIPSDSESSSSNLDEIVPQKRRRSHISEEEVPPLPSSARKKRAASSTETVVNSIENSQGLGDDNNSFGEARPTQDGNLDVEMASFESFNPMGLTPTPEQMAERMAEIASASLSLPPVSSLLSEPPHPGGSPSRATRRVSFADELESLRYYSTSGSVSMPPAVAPLNATDTFGLNVLSGDQTNDATTQVGVQAGAPDYSYQQHVDHQQHSQPTESVDTSSAPTMYRSILDRKRGKRIRISGSSQRRSTGTTGGGQNGDSASASIISSTGSSLSPPTKRARPESEFGF